MLHRGAWYHTGAPNLLYWRQLVGEIWFVFAVKLAGGYCAVQNTGSLERGGYFSSEWLAAVTLSRDAVELALLREKKVQAQKTVNDKAKSWITEKLQ